MVSGGEPEQYDTIILGGGPAGLSCAISCAGGGNRTLVLEKMESCGRKLLISGSGQCNLTHTGEIRDFFRHYGSQGRFLKTALYSWTNSDLCSWFESLGVPLMADEGGKVFPASRRSSDILDVLLRQCDLLGVTVRCGEPVVRVERDGEGFRITTKKASCRAVSLVIATGGASYPATGSTGDGYRFAAALGHTIVPIAPALTPLVIERFPFSDLAGITFPDLSFSIWREGRKMITCRGDVLFSHSGLSGPGILDNSRSILKGDEIRLSFVGGMAGAGNAAGLMRHLQDQGPRRVSSVLRSWKIPGRVVKRILEIAGIDPGLSCAHLTVKQRGRLISSLTGLSLTVAAHGDFSVAMVTKGGVPLAEIHPLTLESRLLKNLYFAGEVMDIDGDTGGYNLQAAFSTGRLAGTSIRKGRSKTPP